MNVPNARNAAGLPNALGEVGTLVARLAGKRPTAFLDYDGMVTPTVDRPQDAIIAERMREVVRGLAHVCGKRS
jgi:trehalose 6-phosphate phosphatase